MMIRRMRHMSMRSLSTHNYSDITLTSEAKEALSAERDADECDMLIVGGGPAGLCAAIRAKQVASERGADVRVVVLEKAADIGNHILSGAVVDPRYLTELLPNWKEDGAPLRVPVKKDKFYWLTKGGSIPLPIPPSLHNHGNYITSLGEVTRWLGEQAENLGVEVFPGFAGAELLRDPTSGAVCGVATGDSGIGKDGSLRGTFARGMELRSRITLLAEGCRGSLTGEAEKMFNLGASRAHPQSYGIGLKEVWRVDKSVHEEGLVVHTSGWPSPNQDYAGSFMYHWDDQHVMVGYVLGLDYKNPYTNPYKEFQQWKQHPLIRRVLEKGECVSYGARALNEGGFQAIPTTHFPGGAIIGCAAGFLNLPKIKGSHNAMKSGMLAAEAAVDKLLDTNSDPAAPISLDNYRTALEASDIWSELHAVRNIRPAFATPLGKVGGIVYAAFTDFLSRGKEPWTLKMAHSDAETLRPAAECKEPDYGKPDGKVSFDLLTNLSRANTNHNDDQPPHLRVQNPDTVLSHNLAIFDGPEQRFCPAGVYEYVDDAEKGGKKLQINAQNCIHCKTCDIKWAKPGGMRWTVPEGGGGPGYGSM